jgi:hypothetical protein
MRSTEFKAAEAASCANGRPVGRSARFVADEASELGRCEGLIVNMIIGRRKSSYGSRPFAELVQNLASKRRASTADSPRSDAMTLEQFRASRSFSQKDIAAALDAGQPTTIQAGEARGHASATGVGTSRPSAARWKLRRASAKRAS